MHCVEGSPLTATNDGLTLTGSLWLPDGREPRAVLVMHPGSGPSDRDNDVFFPAIRPSLLAAGIAVASFDKRGVGGSEGSWLEADIATQARDLLAAVSAVRLRVPDVPVGVFGHSQGGWVVQDALRRDATPDRGADRRLAFGITSSGPGVSTAEQEQFSAEREIERTIDDPDERARARRAAFALIALFERGATHAELLRWAAEHAADAAIVRDMYGTDLPDAALWSHFVSVAAFDPVPALTAIDVPLLAVFGAADDVTPTEASIAALRAHVEPSLLRVASLPGGGHRMGTPESTEFVDDYPDVMVTFILDVLGG